MIKYEFALLIAASAFTYTNLLTRPGKIFNWLYNWLWQIFKNDQRQELGKMPHPLFMVLIHCEMCFAGQAALWLFLFYNLEQYNVIEHIFFVSFTILAAGVIKSIYNKLENNGG